MEQVQEQISEAKTLDAVIAESRDRVDQAQAAEEKKKSGRPAKYASDEERKEARRAQDRAYKAAKRGKIVSDDGTTIQMERINPEPFKPTPAGMSSVLNQVVDMPIYQLRAKHQLTPEEFPGFDPEAKKELVNQADLVLGTFCPAVANSKWTLLGGFIFTATMLYGGLMQQASAIAATKRGGDPEPAQTDGPAPDGPIFPVAVTH